VFDIDHDGLLSREELRQMITTMLVVQTGNIPTITTTTSPVVPVPVEDPGSSSNASFEDVYARLNLKNDEGDDGVGVTLEEYLVWAVDESLPSELLDLLIQVTFKTNICIY